MQYVSSDDSSFQSSFSSWPIPTSHRFPKKSRTRESVHSTKFTNMHQELYLLLEGTIQGIRCEEQWEDAAFTLVILCCLLAEQVGFDGIVAPLNV